MQFLKTLFWVVVAVIMVLFAHDNWVAVDIHIGGDQGFIVDVKKPILALFFFLIGFLPTFIVYRARLWSLRRRLETQIPSGVGNGPAPVRPNPAPAPVRTSSAAYEREADDNKAWPTV